ncbi:MAG: MaoC family dehydratase N-terminal domain-containing protein [Proteobacteria bacterium]|nr:MaoC family dehydratase N-terminal domain-containing protein [Pseudomonadota bacterium]MBU1451465.1 MaoC family dehydratase N-terminal domain-containing protein [Pseudomonadota bacterium]MBU2468373.1 MaoC family dehydratase N-terminal domain-containing protein [Pseudomonadota bacterium]MBU2517776.1 MaoC family dehydratase N-terminal domain-containing protein [Pseudomonadota bacterium]
MNALYYEDFYQGQEFITKGRTVTEADIVNFAALSWDTNALHTDAEFAKQTPFGERIAHGMLGLVMHAGLSQMLGITDGTLLAFMGMTWNFHHPIKIGDTIHVAQRVKELRETSQPDRGLLTFEKELVNQHGQVVQTGTTTVLIARKNNQDQEGL